MRSSFSTPIQEINQVGQARREAQRFCARLSDDLTFAGRVSLVVTELARNLVIHAGGGHIVLRDLSGDPEGGMEVLALDRGPGMRNVGECLRDGYSTAGTPGTGLGAIRRLSDLFDLSTTEGRGTVICSRVFLHKDRVAAAWDTGAVSVALAGESVCGDAWAKREKADGIRVMLADGLGHGFYAAEAAQEAVSVFVANSERPISEVLRLMDAALGKTRGAAAAVVEIQPAKSLVTVAGAGNIAVRVFDQTGKSRQIASMNGTVGTRLHKIQEYTASWSPKSLLVVSSDGLTSQWDLNSYPGLFERHPGTMAGVIYRDYARGRDDATILTVAHHR
jgi:anti-sigma regulatory factor (Ser/Thr protein kinase)